MREHRASWKEANRGCGLAVSLSPQDEPRKEGSTLMGSLEETRAPLASLAGLTGEVKAPPLPTHPAATITPKPLPGESQRPCDGQLHDWAGETRC